MDPKAPAPVEEEVSLRDTVAAAFDEDQKNTESTPEPVVAAPAKEPGAPAPAAAAGATPAPDAPAPVAPAAAASATPAAPAPGAPPEIKAPAQWKPAIREKWSALPREVQEEISRRESDMLRLVGTVGQRMKMADQLNQTLAPYAQEFQQAGVDPMAFIGSTMATVQTLARGSEEQKAMVLAGLVKQYGINVGALDRALSGVIAAPPPDPNIVALHQRLAGIEQFTNQQMQNMQTQLRGNAAQTLESFAADPKNEFFNDVRFEMANLIETGRAQSLDEAYQTAIWANPDTRAILLQKDAEARASAANARAQQARRASSSVHGAPLAGVPVSNANDMSLRQSIEASIEQLAS
jgi:hypothetical protein